jgi:hypothetical protein
LTAAEEVSTGAGVAGCVIVTASGVADREDELEASELGFVSGVGMGESGVLGTHDEDPKPRKPMLCD